MSPIDLAPPAIIAPSPTLWRPAKPFIVRASEDDYNAVKAMPFMAAIAGGARRGPGIPWTPADLSTTPSGWYDAELSSKTLSGTEVSQWNDLSGNGRNATQGTSANRPTYDSANKWLNFDGSNDHLTASSALIGSGNSPFTVAAVVRPDTTASGAKCIYGQGPGTANQAPHVGFNSTNYLNGGFGADLLGGTISSGTEYIVVYTYTSGSRSIWSNGSSVTSDTYSGANWGTTTPRIGMLTTGNYFLGKLRTLIVIQASIGTDERQKLEGYLAHLWSLTASLPSDHPYKSSPPYKV